MPTTRFYPAVPHGTALQALPQMVRWLVNDHPTYVGPGWTIVEAGSDNSREVPSNPSNMDSLTNAEGWRDGSVSIGNWIVLESANANNSNHFQVCFLVAASSSFDVMMMPQSGYVPNDSGPYVTPPAFPTASFGASSGTVFGVRASPSSATYTIVADEGMAAIMCSRADNGVPLGWTYIGELDGARPSGSPPDNRAYVAWTSTSGAFWDDALTTAPRAFHRYSPLQTSGSNTWLTGTTNGGAPCYFTAAGATTIVHNTATIDTLLNVNSVLPVGVYFGGGIHRHFAGFLRNVYSMHADVTSSAGSTAYNGTTSDRRFRYNNSLSGVDAPVVFAWDGSTTFP